jgi:hypothetical protein
LDFFFFFFFLQIKCVFGDRFHQYTNKMQITVVALGT